MAGSTTRRTPDNHLLLSLSASDFALLKRHLSPVELGIRRPLEDARQPIRHVYFPETGIVSVVAEGTRAHQSEIGLIGREGMTGINVVMGNDRFSHQSYVQVAGQGHSMKANELRRAMHESFIDARGLPPLCPGLHGPDGAHGCRERPGQRRERLARWLLMAHDRLEGNELPLTHEFVALMLNVRRAGVTVALQGLSRKRLVTASRGRIVVVDRTGLVAIANGLYGIPEAEYRRLTGWRTKH